MATTDPKSPKRLHSLNIRLDDETMAELKVVAAEEGRTLSNLAWIALRQWLELRRMARPG